MLWLPITVLAYLLNSASLLTDKFLLSKDIKNPSVYVIFISLLGIASLAILPFGWKAPTLLEFAVEILSGFLFAFGLQLMFASLKRGEASRIVPIVGGFQPIFVLPLAWIFLGEGLSGRFLIAFILISLGTIIITYGKGKASRTAYIFAIASAFMYAISLILSKYAFNSQASFITPFVMTRLGSMLFAFVLLLFPKNLRDLRAEMSRPKQSTSLLLVFGQSAGAVSSLLVNIAIQISVGVTAIINSLQGLQYVFLLFAAIPLSKKYSKYFKEDLDPHVFIQKMIAVIIIMAGLVFLSI